MTDSKINIKCLDSSAWLFYYFNESAEMIKIVDEEGFIITSSLSLFEVKKRLLVLKKDYEIFLNFIKERGVIIAPGILIAEDAANISYDNKLPAIDALIYATSKSCNAELITGDNDFRGMDGVRIIG